MVFLFFEVRGLIFRLYLLRVSLGTWSGAESIGFLVVGHLDQRFWVVVHIWDMLVFAVVL